MKRTIRAGLALALAASLAACTNQPKLEAVAAATKTALQAQLAQQLPGERLTVQSVAPVAVKPPEYKAQATLAENGSTFTLPLSVTSDGKTALVEFDRDALAELVRQSWRKRLAVIDGKYADYVFSTGLYELLPAKLRTDKTYSHDFKDRLGTIMPVTQSGDWYFGEGCMPHSCGSEMAAWAINRSTGQSFAVIEHTDYYGGVPSTTSFTLFGGDLYALPSPLAAWAADQGMTARNASEPVNTIYTPPVTSPGSGRPAG